MGLASQVLAASRTPKRKPPITAAQAILAPVEDIVTAAIREAFADAWAERFTGRSPEKFKTYCAWPKSAPLEVVSQATKGSEARAHRKAFPLQSGMATDRAFACLYREFLEIARTSARQAAPAPIENDAYFRRHQKRLSKGNSTSLGSLTPARSAPGRVKVKSSRAAYLGLVKIG
jgi:hypothetical protein